MRCKSCGNKIKKNEQFCTKCGKRIEPKKTEHEGQPRKRGKNRKKRIIVVLFSTMLILAVIFWILVHYSVSPFYVWYYDLVDTFEKEEDIEYNIDDYIGDGDEYYEEKSQVVSKTPITKSNSISTEREFAADISERGFTETYLFYSYDMDGNVYDDNAVVSSDSEEKRPVLEAYVYLDNDSIWHIYEIDGALMAYPVSYMFENECDTPIIISESEEIVSYDNSERAFYRTIPKKSEVIVVTIDEITAESLKNLDISKEVAN